MMKQLHLTAIGLLCISILVGCKGEGPDIVSVSGTVTHNGKPVPNLKIYFVPTNGRPSWGHSDAAGEFTLDYDEDHNGAKVDTHTVWVLYEPLPSSPQEEMQWQSRGGPPKPPGLQEILAKYGKEATSPKKVEVTKAVSDLKLELD
jgi:hypothetical protein